MRAAACASRGQILRPLRVLAAATRRVRITNVESYRVTVPQPGANARSRKSNYAVTRVSYRRRVTGTSFIACPRDTAALGEADTGRSRTVCGRPHWTGCRWSAANRACRIWSGVEHAMWDAIGRSPTARRETAGRAVATSCGFTEPAFFPASRISRTCLTKHRPNSPLRLKQSGYHGIKIRAWRPRPMDDVDMVGVMRAAVGPDFHIMLDRQQSSRLGLGLPDGPQGLPRAWKSIKRIGSKSPSTAMILRTGAPGRRGGHPDHRRRTGQEHLRIPGVSHP